MDLRAQLQAHLGGAYLLERELGGGGMSRVFVADEVRLSRKVVIKVLSPELAQGLNVERFEREILLAASLQQANIVPLLAAGDLQGLPYFTMPFVDGESLRNRIGGGLPIADVIAIVRDVTKALAYAHARNIVHRDIKPDNVLLSGGTAVVTDFGIAKALSASRTSGAGATLTSVGTSIGTPAYMAPEQVAGDPAIDHRVDLYALGCMAYELIAGRTPFADLTPQKMLAAHLSATPVAIGTVRPDCPAPLATLVTQLLRKDPADRPQTATDVLRALDGVVTTSGATMSLNAPGMLPKVLGMYAVATAAVAILAKAAVVGIGLPDWVFPGAVAIMLLGLPALLFTAYVKRVARHAVTATPTLTPGGSSVPRPPSGTMATIALKASPHVSWRRTARGGMIAMGAFVVLIVAFMTLRALGIGPWGSLVAAGKLGAEDRIVLADLKAAPEDSALAPIVIAAVRAAMTQSRAVHLVPQTEIAAALTQMKRAPESRLDNDTVITQVAARTNSKAILGGRLARAGSGYAISLDLVAAQGGAVLASYQATAGMNDLLSVVDGLTRKVRGKVGESLKQVQQTVSLERATTSSLDALKQYSDAVVKNDVMQDYPGAIASARAAVALDSTFALAWRKMAVAMYNAGVPVEQQDSAIERAARYADRLPDREKFLVKGLYYENSSVAADRGQAVAAYQNAYRADSSGTVATNQLALNYEYREQYDSAVRYARRQVQIDARAVSVHKLARELMIAGDTGGAAKLLDSLAKAAPASMATQSGYTAMGSLWVVRSKRDSLKALDLAMSKSADLGVRLAAFRSRRTSSQIEGRLSDAAQADSAVRAIVKSAGLAPDFPLALVAADIRFRGQTARGLQRLEEMVASPAWAQAQPGDRPYESVIELFAMGGKPDRARAMYAQFQNTSFSKAPDARALNSYLQGEIALAEGKTAEALKLFQAANVGVDGQPERCSWCVSFYIAQTFDRAGQPDSAAAYFERYLATSPALRGTLGPIATDRWNLALVERRLGELYDAKHDKARALTHYGAFVDLWRGADADLQPIVATVKKRMGELAGEGK